MKPRIFWSTALATAIALAAVGAWVFPYELLGIESPAERTRAWLLSVWTAGVLAICFGVTGLLGGIAPISFRDVAEAGSVTAAIDARREARDRLVSSFYNFAGWSVVTGAFLLLVYFAGWLLT